MGNGEGMKKIRVERTAAPFTDEGRGRPPKYPFGELAPPEEIQRPGGKVEKQYSFFFVPHKHPSDLAPSVSHWKRRNPDKKHVKIKMQRVKIGDKWGARVVRVA